MGGTLLLGLVFGVSFTQYPLYTSSQNNYFLHGLAQAGVGFLQQDWMATTVDPVPVFTHLVRFTVSALDESFFYLYHLLFAGIYIVGVLGIARSAFPLRNRSPELLVRIALITALHSALNPTTLLHEGIAVHELLGRVFQPSSCGVFLVVSIYAFLRGRAFLAIVCSTLAATLHPVYVLSAALLTFSYIVVLLRNERQVKKAGQVALLALLLILPILLHVYVSFGPTTPEIFAYGQRVLVEYRQQYASNVDEWLRPRAMTQILVVLLALFVTRRTPIFPILFCVFSGATILTLVQVATQDPMLALLYPWRVSVFLVPLSSSLLLAKLASVAFDRFSDRIRGREKLLERTALTALCILPLYGAVIMAGRVDKAERADLVPVMRYVAATKQPTDLYLVPTILSDTNSKMMRFRLSTGAPTFVDTKSHPYKDAELVEWYRRVVLASEFYEARGSTARKQLGELMARYGVTHVIFERGGVNVFAGILQEKLFEDESFVLYDLRTE